MLQLAKQGDPKAIASLINRQLQPRGITTKASLKDGCLQIMLESASVPKQQVMVTGLRKLIASFDVESIQKVKVYGKQIGEEFPDWNEEFEIDRKTTSTSIAASEAISQVSPLPVPEPSATEVNIPSSELNIDPALKELAKQGDVKAISSLISNQLQRNDLVVRASLRNGLLQVVLVSSNVPSQQTTVPIIQDLLTVVESSLINKVKINGLQELSGATNSKLLWSEEFELESRASQSTTEVTIGNKAGSELPPQPVSEKSKIKTIIHEGYSLNVWQYIKQGVSLFLRNWFTFTSFTLPFFVVNIAIFLLDVHISESIQAPPSGLDDNNYTSILIFLRVLFSITNLTIWNLFCAVCLNVGIKILKRQVTRFSDFFIGFSSKYFVRVALFCIVGVLTSLWLTLLHLDIWLGYVLALPSIWLAVSYIFSMPIAIDRDTKFIPAMNLSLNIVGKNWLGIFGYISCLILICFSPIMLIYFVEYLSAYGGIFNNFYLIKIIKNACVILPIPLFTCSIAVAYMDIISMKATERKRNEKQKSYDLMGRLSAIILTIILLGYIFKNNVVLNIIISIIFLAIIMIPVCGLASIPAKIAANKGYSYWNWFWYSLFLLPFAFFHSLSLTDIGTERIKSSSNHNQLNDIEKLSELKDRGIITESEFEAKKKEILDRI